MVSRAIDRLQTDLDEARSWRTYTVERLANAEAEVKDLTSALTDRDALIADLVNAIDWLKSKGQ